MYVCRIFNFNSFYINNLILKLTVATYFIYFILYVCMYVCMQDIQFQQLLYKQSYFKINC